MIEIIILITKGLELRVNGRYTEAEPNVGLHASFEIQDIYPCEAQVFNLIEWCDSQKGNALGKILELCEEKLKNQR